MGQSYFSMMFLSLEMRANPNFNIIFRKINILVFIYSTEVFVFSKSVGSWGKCYIYIRNSKLSVVPSLPESTSSNPNEVSVPSGGATACLLTVSSSSVTFSTVFGESQ